MAATQKRTISLPAEQAAYIDEKVASGTYASVSEVVREGLRSLQDRENASIERWLREEVAMTYDAIEANPEQAIPMEDVFKRLYARHAERMKQKKY